MDSLFTIVFIVVLLVVGVLVHVVHQQQQHINALMATADDLRGKHNLLTTWFADLIDVLHGTHRLIKITETDYTGDNLDGRGGLLIGSPDQD